VRIFVDNKYARKLKYIEKETPKNNMLKPEERKMCPATPASENRPTNKNNETKSRMCINPTYKYTKHDPPNQPNYPSLCIQ